MSQLAHPTLPELHDSVQNLEQWRKQKVDPTLKAHGDALAQHGRKLEAFERIELQITAVIRFLKITGGIVAAIASIVEVTRFTLTLMHLIH